MHVLMDGTTLSADAPDWFHVPHTTVCNMTQQQVNSLLKYKAPVPVHLVPPALRSAYDMKPATPTRTPVSPRSRPSTTASAVRGNFGAGTYSQQQLAQKMSRATRYTHEAAAEGRGVWSRSGSTPEGTQRMANTADRTAVNASFGQPRAFEGRFGVHGGSMEHAAKGMWHERRGQ
jgi:hypothetical protein